MNPAPDARIVFISTFQSNDRLPHPIPLHQLDCRLAATIRVLLHSVIPPNTLRALGPGAVASAEAGIGLDAVDGVPGEEARRRHDRVRGREHLGPVAVVPEVDAAGAVEAVGEAPELVVGGDGEEGGRQRGGGDGGRVGVPGPLEVDDGVAELGALAHLVELALAGEAGLEELLRLPGLHALPLPLGDAARERAGAAAHADDQVPAAEGAAGGRGGREEGEAEAVRGERQRRRRRREERHGCAAVVARAGR